MNPNRMHPMHTVYPPQQIQHRQPHPSSLQQYSIENHGLLVNRPPPYATQYYIRSPKQYANVQTLPNHPVTYPPWSTCYPAYHTTTLPSRNEFDNNNSRPYTERFKVGGNGMQGFQEMEPSTFYKYSSVDGPQWVGQNRCLNLNSMQQDMSNINGAQVFRCPRPNVINTHSESLNKKKINSLNKTENILGCTGLINLGNTCYMNSILQCLSHTGVFLDYCVNRKYKDDMKKNKNKSKGILINALADVLKDLWMGRNSVAPVDFRKKMLSSIKCFEGMDQEDAQEFLMFLLQGLSEDVSRDNQMKKVYTIRHFPAKDKVADKAWKKYLDYENSFIIDIFMGQLRSELTCGSCKNTSYTYDPIMGLSLSIPPERGNEKVSLFDCLKHYFRDEILRGNERANCDNCKSKNNATKRLFIQKFPKVLIIHFKRFSNITSHAQKITTFVEYPKENLDLCEFTNFNAKVSYDLYAVIKHFGMLADGHYTASVKNVSYNTWYEYDDERVEPLLEKDIVNQHAYILFYKLDYAVSADNDSSNQPKDCAQYFKKLLIHD